MGTIWFCLVAIMLTVYVLLDGFDLGAGAIHLLVAKTDEERVQVLASIGPVWEANEVWLIAAGGTLYFAFPALYASGFSGFYLPLMIVLWLLILRGISISFRNEVISKVWDPFWDFLFCASSLLLSVFFGAALANVVRGVPLDASGYFFEPLWTDFRLGEQTGILDWYTILISVLSLLALAMHGALWVQMKTKGPVNYRSAKIAVNTWWGILILTAAVTVITFKIQPQVKENFVTWPWGFIFPLLAVAGIAPGSPGAQSRLFTDCCKRQGRRLRPENWRHVVDDCDPARGRILHLRLPLLYRQSRRWQGPELSLSPNGEAKPLCSDEVFTQIGD